MPRVQTFAGGEPGTFFRESRPGTRAAFDNAGDGAMAEFVIARSYFEIGKE